MLSVDCYCILNNIDINYMDNIDFSNVVLNDSFRYYLLEISSLNVLINEDDDDSELGNFISDSEYSEFDIGDSIVSDYLFDYDGLFSCLSKKEREILELRYGLNGHKEMTLEEVGKKFNIVRERVRQIQNRALRKIRLSKNIEMFEEYMPNPQITHQNLIKYQKENKHTIRKDFSHTSKNRIDINSKQFVRDEVSVLKALAHLYELGKITSIEYVIMSLLLNSSDSDYMKLDNISNLVGVSQKEVMIIIEDILYKLKNIDNYSYSSINNKYTKIKKILN